MGPKEGTQGDRIENHSFEQREHYVLRNPLLLSSPHNRLLDVTGPSNRIGARFRPELPGFRINPSRSPGCHVRALILTTRPCSHQNQHQDATRSLNRGFPEAADDLPHGADRAAASCGPPSERRAFPTVAPFTFKRNGIERRKRADGAAGETRSGEISDQQGFSG